ncbi:uncharacterized protein LOC125666897 [Ostrea edulis]|uniref:uncharacterized protein LOC125666897 n=1 Tax=Ostrea edulis TaxID=37623 RepID=UPI0024AEB9BB|nr:uncharacterized protein LOC125666897 [Ostrea edulis]
MGNRIIEKFNHTFLSMLKTLEFCQKSEWKSDISSSVHVYISIAQDKTRCSPIFLIFGRKPELYVDVFGLSSPQSDNKLSYYHQKTPQEDDDLSLSREASEPGLEEDPLRKEESEYTFKQRVRTATSTVDMKFLVLAICCGICSAELIDKDTTKSVDLTVRTDLSVLINSQYENYSVIALQLLTTCNDSVNAAVAFCDSNCESSGGGGGGNPLQALQAGVDSHFNKFKGGVNAAGSKIKDGMKSFTNMVKKLSKLENAGEKFKQTFSNLGNKIKNGVSGVSSKALNELKKLTGTIGGHVKKWAGGAKKWFEDTFGRRRRRAAALSCELCNRISAAKEDKLLETVCGTEATTKIYLYTTMLDKMAAMMSSMSESTLVLEVDTDNTKSKVVSFSPLTVESPFVYVKYTVNGTTTTVRSIVNPPDMVNLASTTSIANVATSEIYKSYLTP